MPGESGGKMRSGSRVEAAIAVTLIALVAHHGVQSIVTRSRHQSDLLFEKGLTDAAEGGLALLAAEAQATSSTAEEAELALDVGGAGVTFRRRLPVDPAAWSEPITYAFALDPGERPNDEDDDGDGLADEGRIVRKQAGRTTVVVDEVAPGARFELGTAGERVSLRVSFDVVRCVRDRWDEPVIRRRAVRFAALLPE